MVYLRGHKNKVAAKREGYREALRDVVIPGLVLVMMAVLGVHYLHSSHAEGTGVAVSGNRLYKDGQPFTPRGFTMVGLLAPPGCGGAGNTAYTHLNQNEMNAAKNVWKANTLRFQVSQNGLSGSGYPSGEPAAYLNKIQAGVQLARDNGFVVILSLQDESVGCGPARPLPLESSVAVWNTLANTFKNDPYIIFQLWNEPNNNTSATRPPTLSPTYDSTLTWPDWKDGRTTAIKPTAGESWTPYVPVGHQRLLDEIRSTGASNVVMAMGAKRGEHLEGMPMLSDPLQPEQVAYSGHGYYFQTSQSDWDTRWGYLAATKPLVITEWNMDCGNARQAAMAQQYLDYLAAKHIGITPWGFDFPATLISDWNYTPTSPSNCSNKAGGQIIKDYFNAYKDPTPPPTDNPPVVSISSPTPGATVSGKNVGISAIASDDNGVKNVAFGYKTAAGSVWTAIGTPAAAGPYTISWDTTGLVSGTYVVRAVATDSAGQTTTALVNVTVNNVVTPPKDTTKPEAGITAPASGTTIQLVGSMVAVSVHASDNVAVTKVELLADNAVVASLPGGTSTTYAFNWNTKGTTLGKHSLTARAYDAAGNVGLSTAVAVTLAETPPPPPVTPGDANGDNVVNGWDFSILRAHDGQNYPAADFNHDGIVDGADLVTLIKRWTP